MDSLRRFFSATVCEDDAPEPELDPETIADWLAGAKDGPPAGEFRADSPASLRALLHR